MGVFASSLRVDITGRLHRRRHFRYRNSSGDVSRLKSFAKKKIGHVNIFPSYGLWRTPRRNAGRKMDRLATNKHHATGHPVSGDVSFRRDVAGIINCENMIPQGLRCRRWKIGKLTSRSSFLSERRNWIWNNIVGKYKFLLFASRENCAGHCKLISKEYYCALN